MKRDLEGTLALVRQLRAPSRTVDGRVYAAITDLPEGEMTISEQGKITIVRPDGRVWHHRRTLHFTQIINHAAEAAPRDHGWDIDDEGWASVFDKRPHDDHPPGFPVRGSASGATPALGLLQACLEAQIKANGSAA
jgi:hypothetical protein